MTIAFERMDNFGAEVIGLDLSKDVSDADRAELYRLWLDEGVLLFRGASNDAAMQMRIAQVFGPLQVHPAVSVRVEGEPNLIYLGNEGDGDNLPVHFVNSKPVRGFLYWHSDMTYVPDINKGSLLRMVEKPADGGRTEWVDTAGAYDDLPEQTKRRIDSLHAVHVSRVTPERAWGNPRMTIRAAVDEEYRRIPTSQTFDPVIHPLVIAHQETGRKSLLLSPLSFLKIEGLSEADGDDLFEDLVTHCLQPKYRYIHDWDVGDMILWDNRRTMHFATGYPPEQNRMVIRATLAETQTTGRLYKPEMA